MWTVVATLAILKSGAACVPLDPSHPDHRIEERIVTVGATMVLTSPRANRSAFARLVRNVVEVDRETLVSSNVDLDVHWSVDSNPSDPVWALFTSESTGIPKTIVWEHAMLCTTFLEHAKPLMINKHSQILQFAAHVCDQSVWDMFAPLVFGGCVFIPSEQQRMNDVSSFMREARVNWAHFTPTVARHLRPADLPCLQSLVLGGEMCTSDVIDIWVSKTRLVNLYGPTETGLYCSIAIVSDQDKSDPTNIGFQSACNLYLTHPSNSNILMPPGAIGEIVVDGPIVSRGYLNNPEAQLAFISPPTWARTSSVAAERRLYRTGDLARWNNDASLQFVGRKGLAQVKIRGQRVNPAEVEYIIKQDSNIQDAVVFAPTSGKYQHCLVAVISMVNLSETSTTVLQACSREAEVLALPNILEAEERLTVSLPTYSIPQEWLLMQALPGTVSGKLDRRRILEHVNTLQSSRSVRLRFEDGEAVASETEHKLQHAWADVLQCPIDQITRTSSLFRLGGDSVTAMRLVRKVHDYGLQMFLY